MTRPLTIHLNLFKHFMKACKQFANPLKKMHPFNTLDRMFKQFAYLFKKFASVKCFRENF